MKLFTIEKVSEKSSKFTVQLLQNFSLEKLQEHDGIKFEEFKKYISIRCLTKLLYEWGFVWGKNNLRPFFEGHENEDVVKCREEFTKYFISNKALFDILVKNEPIS